MTDGPTDFLAFVDPELRRPLQFVLSLMPSGGDVSPEEARQAARARGAAMAKPFLAEPTVVEREIAAGGEHKVTAFVINAAPGRSRPAILHTHGGGFMAGSARASVADLQVQAKALDCVIVTVEYRLAPETPFPGALEDNYAVLCWVHDHAQEFGVDLERIALQGESAGAGHAAMLALAVRERGGPPVCFQALVQPMLDDRTGSTRPRPPHMGAFLWTPELNVAGWTSLLGAAPGGAAAPRGAVPARVESLAGLPPTFIAVGSIDLFVIEDTEFAQRLMSDGVATELLVVPGAFHGYDLVAPEASCGRRARLALLNALARAFGQGELAEPPAAAPWAFPLPSEAVG